MMQPFENPKQSPVVADQAPGETEAELDSTAGKWLTAYVKLGEKISELEDQKAKARQQILNFATEHEAGVLTVNGKPAATVTTQTTKRLNTKAFKEKEPELYEAFSYETESQVLRLKK